MTTLIDRSGYTVSGANAESLDAFEQSAHEMRCLINDPVASIDRALQSSAEMTMAHLVKAWLHLLGTEPAGFEVARACADAAALLPANQREQGHLAAVRALTAGRWHEAARLLEDLSVLYPYDLVALQVGHQLDFFTGDSRMLRDRIARALPAWDRSRPGYHALLGMYAFGLEETGDYAQAEAKGRAAVELQARDCWAWHAVAHVMEMRNRPHDGIAWLHPHTDTWGAESFFAVHNWWHLALFHLELDDSAEVLRLYDAAIGGPGSTVVLDMIDASAMLWRLMLRGIDVGDRWSALAERWAPVALAGQYAFNDAHAMMAFVGSGRSADQEALLDAQREALNRSGDNVRFLQDVGQNATQALHAFGAGDYTRCVQLLRPIRNIAHRFGGSHAQRDVLDLTLIEAALRAGDRALAGALAAERSAMRPESPLARRLIARSMPLERAA